MTKGTLITVSAVRDFLDFIVIGQVPPLSWMLSAPVLLMHFVYAGPRAVVCLLEMVPLAGVIPVFTLAALSYPDPKKTEEAAARGALPTEVVVRRALPDPDDHSFLEE